MKVMDFSVFAVGAKLNQELVAKFKAADINHDSKLIPAEVQAYMSMVANHFSDTDMQNRGYVTLSQIISKADSR